MGNEDDDDDVSLRPTCLEARARAATCRCYPALVGGALRRVSAAGGHPYRRRPYTLARTL